MRVNKNNNNKISKNKSKISNSQRLNVKLKKKKKKKKEREKERRKERNRKKKNFCDFLREFYVLNIVNFVSYELNMNFNFVFSLNTLLFEIQKLTTLYVKIIMEIYNSSKRVNTYVVFNKS